MGILNIIRQKTDNQKKIFSLVMASLLTLIIVVVWFSFNEETKTQKIVKEEPSKLSSISPIDMIKDEFSKAFSDFNTKMAEIETVSTTSSSTESIIVDEVTSIVATSSLDNIEEENINEQVN
jgi:hypothetical protein